MRNTVAPVLALLLLAGQAWAEPAASPPAIAAGVYDRAAQFVPENAGRLVLNASIAPHWRAGGRERLTYRKELGDDRHAFIQLDAATGARSAAFDHNLLAAGLSTALGKPVDAQQLPFADYDELAGGRIGFAAMGEEWTCSTVRADCRGIDAPAFKPTELASPDGRWVAYTQDFNLWVRSADGKTRFALTTDGVQHYAYAVATELSIGALNADGADHALSDKDGRHIGLASPIVAAWSPDSRRLLTHRLDERQVREMPIVQSAPPDGSKRPVATIWRMAMPNDPVIPTAEPWIFDVAARTGRRIDIDPVATPFITQIESKDAWWSPDGGRIFELVKSRYQKSATLYVVDPASGKAREVLSEASKTFIEFGSILERPMIYPLANGDLLWFSERDGHGHLYIYDLATGALKRRLTQGDWTVRNVLRVDETAGAVYVAGNEREAGDDPYFRKIYRIGLKDGKVALLTPEDADHSVETAQTSIYSDLPIVGRTPDQSRGFSPSGRYFVETQSRPDRPSRTVLRRSDGTAIAEVEHADISRLSAIGFTMPERFHALAADGKTVLYGAILRPSNFDPAKRYPVLDAVYPGPQVAVTPIAFESAIFQEYGAQTYAELGFVVVLVDGRGSKGRSKAFHDLSYGHLGDAGHLDDHVAVIRQLAARYPYMDLDRVGVFGSSGGGYASTHAILTYPDFFKVAVSDAGSHDQRGYLAVWGETYNGPEVGTNYLDASNAELAGNLKGKLLLMHGGMDINVSPSLTLQLVDALIKANKDFDLLIVPNAGHTVAMQGGYSMRRGWDFMVRNLMGAEPPHEYDMSKAPDLSKASAQTAR